MARLSAASLRWAKHKEVVTDAQILATCGIGGELYAAVFGEREAIGDLITQYVNDGLPTKSRVPSASADPSSRRTMPPGPSALTSCRGPGTMPRIGRAWVVTLHGVAAHLLQPGDVSALQPGHVLIR